MLAWALSLEAAGTAAWRGYCLRSVGIRLVGGLEAAAIPCMSGLWLLDEHSGYEKYHVRRSQSPMYRVFR